MQRSFYHQHRLFSALLLCILPECAFAQAIVGPDNGRRCDVVDFSADEMSCERSQCTLENNARLLCGELWVSADSLLIRFDEANQRFLGAEAKGDVTAVDGGRVWTCSALRIEEDQIRGRIDDAVLYERSGAKDEAGLPTGASEQTLRGNIERLNQEKIRVRNAIFTTCDCGDALPSWEFRAKRIEATLGERATLFGPKFYIRPFGLKAIPLSPPLPPISLPLKARAPGFLPPNISFINNVSDLEGYAYVMLPSFSVPFFVPLGDSVDITPEFGLRRDWGLHGRLERNGDLAFPALTFANRLRYTPSEKHGGEFKFSLIYDHSQSAGKLRALSQNDGRPLLHSVPGVDDAVDPFGYNLLSRWAIIGRHDSQLSQSLALSLVSNWVSDDFYLQDTQQNLADQVQAYNRSQLELRFNHGSFHGHASADIFHRLQTGGAGANAAPSNLNEVEWQGPQAAPLVDLRLHRTHLVDHLFVEADAQFFRYGAWQKNIEAELQGAHTNLSLGYSRPFWIFESEVFAGLDGTWENWGVSALGRSDGPDDRLRYDLSYSIGASLRAPFGAQFKKLHHVLTPELRVHSRAPLTGVGTFDERIAIHPWQLRAPTHVLLARLHQRVEFQNKIIKDLELELFAPLDLSSGSLLESGYALSFNSTYFSLEHRLSADLDADQGSIFRSTESALAFNIKGFRLGIKHFFWSNEADRFRRAIDALAAPDLQTLRVDGIPAQSFSSARFLHILQPSLAYKHRIAGEIKLSSQIQFQARGQRLQETFVNNARLDWSYRSSCRTQCWSIGLYGELRPGFDSTTQRWNGDLRPNFGVAFEVGGYGFKSQ